MWFLGCVFFNVRWCVFLFTVCVVEKPFVCFHRGFSAVVVPGFWELFPHWKLSGMENNFYVFQAPQRNAFWLVLCNKQPPKNIPLGVLVFFLFVVVFLLLGILCSRFTWCQIVFMIHRLGVYVHSSEVDHGLQVDLFSEVFQHLRIVW